MQISNIDLTTISLDMIQDVVIACKEIINENLRVNGGTLKKANIFEKDYNWSNLIIASINNIIVGFALIRKSKNEHNLGNIEDYYYLSEIAVKNEYKRNGIGTALMEETIVSISDKPLVASALKDNLASVKLLSKFMTCYGLSRLGKYYRFVDNKTYNMIFGDSPSSSMMSI